MTALYSGNLLDERNGRPIEGASLWVYDMLGAEATLTDIANQPLTQPILTGVDGEFKYKAVDGVYRHDFWKNSVKIYTDERVIVGVPGTISVATGAFGTTLVASVAAANARTSLAINSAAELAALPGTSLIGYNPGLPGTSLITNQSKLRQRYDTREFTGILANGTDETTTLVTRLTGLGAAWEGVIHNDITVRGDAKQIIEALPSKAILDGVFVFQSGAGYRQQLRIIADDPPDANTDTAYCIASTHYADLMLNNLRSAGTSSALRGLSGVSWARDFYRNGTKGPRVQWQTNFAKSDVRTAEYGGKGLACFAMIVRAPERAGNYEEYFVGITLAIGDYVLAPNNYFYRATTAGVSSAAPTSIIIGGSQTIGGISWVVESGEAFRNVFYVDENARIGTKQVEAGTTHLWEQGGEDPENFVVRYRARGVSKSIEHRYEVTTAAAAPFTAVPYMQVSEGAGGLRWLDSAATRALFYLTDGRGLSLGVWGLFPSAYTLAQTTPSVAGGGYMYIANTGAITITNLLLFLPDQRVELEFGNGNTTLQHGALMKLKGAVNVTPVADQIITLKRNATNAYWIEVCRNF